MKNSQNTSLFSKILRLPNKYLTHFFTVFILSAPLLISAFSAQSANLINSILTGHYNHVDLAAVSYGFLMVMSIGSIARGAIGSLLPVLQKAYKENDLTLIGACFYTLIIYLAFSILIFLFFFIGTYYLDVSEYYQIAIRSYLVVMFVFLIALQVLAYFINSLIIYEKIKIMAVFGLCATSIDIVFSSLFVHGVGFLPSLGAQGAALGSVAGSVLVTGLVIWYLKSKQILKIKLMPLNKLIFKEVIGLLKISLPAGFTAVLTWLLMFGVTMFLTFMEGAELNTASNQILMILSTLVLVFSNVSSGILVKLFNEVNNKMEFMIQNIIGYQIFYWVLLILIGVNFELIVNMFGVPEMVFEIIEPLKRFLFIYLIFANIDIILTSYFMSQQKNIINFNTQILTLLFSLLVASILFFMGTLSLNGLWMILACEKTVTVLIKIFYLAKKSPSYKIAEA